VRRTGLHVLLATVLLVTLGGCMYPQEKREAMRTPPAESVLIVQNAVDRFYEEQGYLPIKNFDEHTPLYERYKIDFEKLMNMQYIHTVPSSAFENGGHYYFVLVDVEENPTVKLLDLLTIQTVGNIENDIHQYAQKNGRYPLGEPVTGGWYRLDYAALGLKSSPVKSVFSGTYTGLLIHETGAVAVDYAPDIMTLVQREQRSGWDEDEDLRKLLIDHSYFVPVRSYPYYWKEGQPVIAEP
jgi:hypothetical protein